MIQIALIGIGVVLLATLFKSNKSEFAIFVSFIGCVVICLLSIGKLEIIINTIRKIQSYINLNPTYISILIKIIGITYVSEFSSSICKDSGYSAVANQIELVGKLTILATGMPILLALLDTINTFLTA